MSQKYELQAARIESVLSAHKVPARVWQATVTPRFVRFDVTTALGTRLTKVSGLAEELAFSLGAQATRVYREGGVLHVEVPRDTPRTVGLLELCGRLSSVPPNCAVLGIDEGGVPLLVRLDSPDVAHLLLAGTTGSGKTALLRTLLLTLAMHNPAGRLQMVLIDPKSRGLSALAELPHVWRPAGQVGGTGVIAGVAEAAGLLDLLVAEMVRARCGRLQPAAAGGGHRRAGRPAAVGRQGRGRGADAADAARPGGGGARGGGDAAAGRDAGGRAGEGQLPGAAGGQRGQSRGCQGGGGGGRHGRRAAVGAGRLPAGGQGAGDPLPGGVCGGRRAGGRGGAGAGGRATTAQLAAGAIGAGGLSGQRPGVRVRDQESAGDRQQPSAKTRESSA